MLYAIDSGKYITKIPHKAEFTKWMQKLSPSDYQAIVDALNVQIDSSDVITAGWIPGHDWTGTVYEPIYKVCGRNQNQAGLFYGLILFDILMNRTDKTWGFGRFENDGKPLKSMTYCVLSLAK